MVIRKSLKEEQEEQNRFNNFLKEFGIDQNADCYPDSPFYKGDILTIDEILQRLQKIGFIGKSLFGRLKGRFFVWCHSSSWCCYKDPSSYYAGYWFRLIDKNPNRYQLTWEDTLGAGY